MRTTRSPFDHSMVGPMAGDLCGSARSPGRRAAMSTNPFAPAVVGVAPVAWRAVARAVVDRPIGMLDSGFGGLTVARAVIDLLPAEDLVYIGDTGRCPYGPKPLAEVAAYARQIAWTLVKDFDVKVLVVACNTAAAAAPIHELAAELPVPVLGVIEPGARSLVLTTETRHVGVIGTVGTVGSGAYQRAVVDAVGAAAAEPVHLTCAACPGFVEFVERGVTRGDEITVLAERLLAPVREADVDALLLGCTHYPLLARVIGDVMGHGVTLVSSADETAFELADLLTRLDLRRRPDHSHPGPAPANHRFLSSGDVTHFAELGRLLLGPELDRAEPISFHDHD